MHQKLFGGFYEFPLHNRYPKVYSLDIHLEDCQQLYFEDTTILQDILQGEPKKTQLISFFEYNQNNGGVNARLTYSIFLRSYGITKKIDHGYLEGIKTQE